MMADEGCFCSPHELAGLVTAANQKDLSAKPDNIALGTNDPRTAAGFEYGMGKEHVDSSHQVLDYAAWADGTDVSEQSIRAELKMDKRQARNFMGAASSFFKDGFFDHIDGIMKDFKANYDPEDKGIFKAYQDEVVPELKDIQYAIEDAFYGNGRGETAAQKKAIDAELAEFGIKSNQIYEAQQYLNWLQRGEFYKKPGMFGEVATTVAKAQAAYNVSWTLFNVADFPRILAPYVLKPKVLIEGVKATFDRSNKSVPDDFLQAIPGVENEGGKFDPFSLTNKLQQRLAFNLDKADGGDGFKGMRENAFIHEPHDPVSLVCHSNLDIDGTNGVIGLGRFLMSETFWTMGNYVNVLKFAQGKGDVEKLKSFLVYNTMKSALFGVGSVMPKQVYDWVEEKLPEEYKPYLQAGVANFTGDGLLKLAGVEGRFTMTEAVQPLGLVLGARSQQISGDILKAGNSIVKAIQDGSEGRLAPAALESFVTLGALSTVIPMDFKNRLGVAGIALSDLDKAPALRDFLQNNQTMKVFSTIAKGIREEQEVPQMQRNIAKAILGNKVIKKEEDDD